MNILWLSPTPSHPQNAGNRARIYSLIKLFQEQGHHITFVYFAQEGKDPQAISAMQEEWDEFHLVPFSGQNRKKTQASVWGVDDWYEQTITDSICGLLRRKPFDVVFCEYVFLSKALELFPAKCVKVIDTHDRFGDRADLLRRNGVEPDFFYTTPQQEAIGLNRADIVIAIQDAEADYYRSITSAQVFVIGHVVESTAWQWRIKKRNEKQPLRIGYFGSGNSLNRKSINQFLDAYCKNEELVSRSELIFAGSICKHITYPSEAKVKVTLLGSVNEITDFYKRVDLAINPMVDGTGLKIKTIEALNFGVPIVSTCSGSDGLPVSAPFHLSAVPQDLVSQIANILEQNNLLKVAEESQLVLGKYKARLELEIETVTTQIEKHLYEKSQKKTVVVVTEAPFWEGNNGKHERILSLCNELKQHCLLKVFFFGSVWQRRLEEIAAKGYEGIVVSFKDYEKGKPANDVPSLSNFANLPGLKRWRHFAFYNSFAKFVAAEKPDVVVLEYIYLSYLRDAIPEQSISVLDTHDIMSFREYRFYNYGFDHHISLSLAEEKNILERFDAVVAIQEQEYNLLRHIIPSTPVLLCPHAIPEQENLKPINSPIHSIGFIGGTSLANRVGLEWFLNQVWPVIKFLDFELLIFGSIGNDFNAYCKRDSRVKIMSSKLTQSEIYQMTDCMINPVFVGGGLKIKTIEAISFGKPIVSTEEGAIGIGKAGKNGILIARDRNEFIDSFIRLVQEPNLAQDLVKQGQQLVQEKFLPATCYEPLVSLARYAS